MQSRVHALLVWGLTLGNRLHPEFVFRVIKRVIKKETGCTNPAKPEAISIASNRALERQQGGMMAVDPVCGMKVDEESTEFQTTYGGKDFYFCSEECETKFDENPDQYATAVAA